MSQKKTTTKESKPSASISTLAEALSVVMNHPKLPVRLHDYLAESLGEFIQPALNELEYQPATIERGINLYLAKEGASR